MLQRIHNSKSTKVISINLIFCLLFNIFFPSTSYALTGGAQLPDFSNFTEIGTSDMVDLSSGDMSYNIPLMDVGGYPLNISYSSSVANDDESPMVGLGWSLSVGQINRNVRGLPDDFDGDEIQHENYLKPNITVGGDVKFTPGAFGLNPTTGLQEFEGGDMSYGLSLMYNNYEGFTVKPSVGASIEIGNNASIGFNVQSGPDGLSVQPNLSVHGKFEDKHKRNGKMGVSVGCSMNSRAGLTSTSMSMYRRTSGTATVKMKNKTKQVDGSSSMSVGSSIGFAETSYSPSKRVGMETGSFTVNASLGAEIFGVEGQMQVTAYGTVQKVRESEKNKKINSYGYQNTDKAGYNDAMDFSREKESAVSVNTSNLPITSYTYDIYSVQGQGVSGMFRPYRNSIGYVHDAEVTDGSTSGSLGFELGTGNAVHGGIDFDVTSTTSRSGMWNDNNSMSQKLRMGTNQNIRFEKFHFKNVGDLSVDEEMNNSSNSIFNRTGRYLPVRVNFVGNKFHRRTSQEFVSKTASNGNESIIPVASEIKRNGRASRNQAIFNLTVGEIKKNIGYSPIGYNTNYDNIYMKSTSAPSHHTGEIQVIRNDGALYDYGIAAYNKTKREATFAVNSANSNAATGLVSYNPNVSNSVNNSDNDKYFNRVTTPAYAHTYLLTSVLSSDYVDKGARGFDSKDLGNYTFFDYELKNSNYKWRVPFQENTATLNEGMKTEDNDDQGNYVYGEKEIFMIKKIETKTHIAIFYNSTRHDGYGVKNENGGIGADQFSYKLDSIKLFSKSEYDLTGINAKPIKQANFVYDYSLCTGIPNNDGISGPNDINQGGKLTLKKIYFTYRGSKMGKYSGYNFEYNSPNPNYNIKSYDMWGNYMPTNGNSTNQGDPSAAEFPFTNQDFDKRDDVAGAWLLTDINLPSGGKISVKYESDSYQYVQNKKAMRMFKIAGVGKESDPSASVTSESQLSEELYESTIFKNPKEYIYMKLPSTESNPWVSTITSGLIAKSMLFPDSGEKMYFRFLTNMTTIGGTGSFIGNDDKAEYVTGYMDISNSDWGLFSISGQKYISIPVKFVDRNGSVNVDNKVHPITMTAWNFGKKYLNKYVYSNMPNGDTDDVEELVNNLFSPTVINNLIEIFTGPNATLEKKLIGKNIVKEKSWLRLYCPNDKFGGGVRVKSVSMTDMWEAMSTGETIDPTVGYETSTYGQVYKYTLEKPKNAGNNYIEKSSGVATYEPIGNKENPFVQPVFSTTRHLMAPAEHNYVELPYGESFFPSPKITYSRVEVSSLASNNESINKLHKTGKVVSEFYTTKDYPTIVDQTRLELEEDKRDLLDNILKINVKKHLTASQGFVIHLNDMDSKARSTKVYAQGQDSEISSVEYLYDNYAGSSNNYGEFNKGKLNNEVKVIYPNGDIKTKTIGVEVDVINDFMANESTTETIGVNTNLAMFIAGIFPLFVPMPLPDYSHSEDKFRAISTTKVINTFGILKETVAMEDGTKVSTKNLAWDASTGEVLLTETVNEYNDKYYSLNYPAHWFYEGMDQAAINLGLTGNLVPNSNLTSAYSLNGIGNTPLTSCLTAGDKLVDVNTGTFYWVKNIQNNSAVLMDKSGAAVTNLGGIKIKVVESGHQNLQSAGIMNVTLMRNPLKNLSNNDITNLGSSFLVGNTWSDWKIINARAVDYSDYWPSGCECGVNDTANQYLTNERGVWRTKSSRTYLTGRNYNNEIHPRFDGFYTQFSPMYKLSNNGAWTKSYNDPNEPTKLVWTFVSEVSIFSPFGFELENKDAIDRYSAAQYGFSNKMPLAVGANLMYRQIGNDGFEDYSFVEMSCSTNSHFSFYNAKNDLDILLDNNSHTGKHSLRVKPGKSANMTKKLYCPAN
jgi:hypothetical protein